MIDKSENILTLFFGKQLELNGKDGESRHWKYIPVLA